jgi:hypothetical protein
VGGYLSNMKIIITESQYNELVKKLPPHIRRRMSEDDMEILEKLIWETAEDINLDVEDHKDFVDFVVREAMHDFITGYKFDGVEDSDEVHSKIYDIWWEIVPIIKDTFNLELTIYYLMNYKGLSEEEIIKVIKRFM